MRLLWLGDALPTSIRRVVRDLDLCHRWAMDLRIVPGIVLGVLAAWGLALVVLWVLRPRGVAVRDVFAVVPDLVGMLRSVVTDGTVPLDVRVLLVGLLAWILSPIDLIPEFIPVLGPLDDVVVAIVALRYVRRRLGVAELRSRWPGTDDGFAVLGRVVGFGPVDAGSRR